jgi:hypothetical protein
MSEKNEMSRMSRDEEQVVANEREEGPEPRFVRPVDVVLPTPRPDLDAARDELPAARNDSPLPAYYAGGEDDTPDVDETPLEDDDVSDGHVAFDDLWGFGAVSGGDGVETPPDSGANAEAERHAAASHFDKWFPHGADYGGDDEESDGYIPDDPRYFYE